MPTTHASSASQRSAFPDALFAELRQRLEAERAAVLARGDVDPGDESFSLTATHGQGETELASRDIALANTRARADAASVASIDAALTRLDDSSYGICESCAEPIPLERLSALPDATRCVICQRDRSADR